MDALLHGHNEASEPSNTGQAREDHSVSQANPNGHVGNELPSQSTDVSHHGQNAANGLLYTGHVRKDQFAPQAYQKGTLSRQQTPNESVPERTWDKWRKAMGPTPSGREGGKLTRLNPTTPVPNVDRNFVDQVEYNCRSLLEGYGYQLPRRHSNTWFGILLDWVPKELEARRTKMYDLSEKFKNLEFQMNEEWKKVSQITGEREHLRQQYETASNGYLLKAQELRQEKSNIDKAHHIITEKDAKIQNLEGLLISWQSDHANLTQRLCKETQMLQGERSRVEKLNNEIHRLGEEHSREIRDCGEKLRREEEIREGMKKTHEQKIATMEKTFDEYLIQETKKHERVILKQKQIIASHNVEDYRPVPDDVFQMSFQTLGQNIRNLIGFIPRADHLALDDIAEIDPTNFVARANHISGHGVTRPWPVFFQSLCWRILVKGFFQGQPGYGVLGGQGEGYEMLNGLRELFTQSKGHGMLIKTCEEVFGVFD